MKNDIASEIEQDINIILNPLKSPYKFEREFSINQLIIYLNIKRTYIDEIIKGISIFFKNEIDSIEEIYFYKVINIFSSELEENNLSNAKFISEMLPFLMNKIYNYKQKKQKDDNILFNTISNCIQKCENNVGQIELCLNTIFEKLIDEKNQLDDNAKIALIKVLSDFLHNAPNTSFYKIIKFSNDFKKIISDFKHKNKNIRKSVEILIEEFILILLNRDVLARKTQSETIIYNTCIKDYIEKENNDEFVLHGLILVLKAFTIKNPKNEKQMNEFFVEKYKIFLDFLYSNLSSQNPLIKISVIETITKYCEFLPNILEEKDSFQYFEKILKDLISLYSDKDNDDKIKIEILKALGQLSILEQFGQIFSENINEILGIIKKDISESKTFNENILEILSDFMTKYDEEFVELLPFDIYYEKIFTLGLKESHIPFFRKLLSIYPRNSRKNNQITICLLNVISYIITQKQFNFKYIKKKIQINSNLFHIDESAKFTNDKKGISQEYIFSISSSKSPKYSADKRISLSLTKSLSSPLNDVAFTSKDMEYFFKIGKIISEYIKDKKGKGISFSSEIKNALSLLGLINNKIFEKEILNFYLENCIKLLKKNDKEIKKNIILLGNSPWIPKIEIKNNTNYDKESSLKIIFQNFLDLLLVDIDDEIKLLILKIIDDQRYLQLLVKENYFMKFIALVEYDSNSIKEKSVEIISKSVSYNNKINTYIKRKIIQICLYLVTSNNQYRQEKNLILLTYFIKYAGNSFDDETIKMIFTNLLKILKKENIENISDDYKNQNDVIKLGVLSVISELMNKQNYNKSLEGYLTDIMSISINMLEENISSSPIKEKTSLNTILSILTNSDKDWKIYTDYIDLVKLLIDVLSKSTNKQSRLYALKIFGNIGTKNPDKLEILFNIKEGQNEKNVNEFYIADEINNYSDTEIIHQKNELIEGAKNQREKKQFNKINVSQSLLVIDKGKSIDFKKFIREKKLNSTIYYTIKALMKILLNNNKYHLNSGIVNLLKEFLEKLNESDYPVIYLILPTLIVSIDNFEENIKILAFEIILYVLTNFINESQSFAEKVIIKIIEEFKSFRYLKNNNKKTAKHIYLEIIDKLCELYSDKVSPSYKRIIPIILNYLSDKEDISASTKRKIISSLKHMGGFLANYFSLVIPKLTDYLSSLINKIKLFSYVNNTNNYNSNNINNIIFNDNENNINVNINTNNASNNNINENYRALSIFSYEKIHFYENNNLINDPDQKIDNNELVEEKKLQQDILELIYILLDFPGIINYMERLINNLCNFMESAPSFKNIIMEIFLKMLHNYKNEFLFFLPYIINFFKKISIPCLSFLKDFRSGLENQVIFSLFNKEHLSNETNSLIQPRLESNLINNDIKNKEKNSLISRINSQNNFVIADSNNELNKSLNNNSFNSAFSKRQPSSLLSKFHPHHNPKINIKNEIMVESLIKEFDTKKNIMFVINK